MKLIIFISLAYAVGFLFFVIFENRYKKPTNSNDRTNDKLPMPKPESSKTVKRNL